VTDIRLLPISDRGAIFYRVVIDVANQKDPATGDWQLRPGMTASVDVVVRRHDDAWKVPIAAVNLQMPEDHIGDAARARLAQWQGRKDRDQWKAVWVLKGREPWPLFVRLGGTDGRGETGIHDAQFDEVLEWDPDLQPPPDPKNPETAPRLIIAAPPPKQGSIFNLPKVKL
jgi:hypothetical protein